MLEGVVAKSVSGGCSAFAIVSSILQILCHLRNYTEPANQRYIIRIIFLVPTFAIASWLSLMFREQAVFIEKPRDCYEAWVIYNFMALLFSYAGGPGAVVIKADGKVVEPSWVFGTCCLPSMVVDGFFLRRCKQGTIQFVILKPLLAAATLFLLAAGQYQSGIWGWDSGYMYITVVYNLTYTLALLALIEFYLGTKEVLHPYDPELKFISVKLIVFLTFWQGIIISAAGHWGYAAKPGEAEVAQNWLVTVEMALSSIMMWFAFPHWKYKIGGQIEGMRWAAVKHALSVEDVMGDIVHQFRPKYSRYVLHSDGGPADNVMRTRFRSAQKDVEDLDEFTMAAAPVAGDGIANTRLIRPVLQFIDRAGKKIIRVEGEDGEVVVFGIRGSKNFVGRMLDKPRQGVGKLMSMAGITDNERQQAELLDSDSDADMDDDFEGSSRHHPRHLPHPTADSDELFSPEQRKQMELDRAQKGKDERHQHKQKQELQQQHRREASDGDGAGRPPPFPPAAAADQRAGSSRVAAGFDELATGGPVGASVATAAVATAAAAATGRPPEITPVGPDSDGAGAAPGRPEAPRSPAGSGGWTSSPMLAPPPRPMVPLMAPPPNATGRHVAEIVSTAAATAAVAAAAAAAAAPRQDDAPQASPHHDTAAAADSERPPAGRPPRTPPHLSPAASATSLSTMGSTVAAEMAEVGAGSGRDVPSANEVVDGSRRTQRAASADGSETEAAAAAAAPPPMPVVRLAPLLAPPPKGKASRLTPSASHDNLRAPVEQHQLATAATAAAAAAVTVQPRHSALGGTSDDPDAPALPSPSGRASEQQPAASPAAKDTSPQDACVAATDAHDHNQGALAPHQDPPTDSEASAQHAQAAALTAERLGDGLDDSGDAAVDQAQATTAASAAGRSPASDGGVGASSAVQHAPDDSGACDRDPDDGILDDNSRVDDSAAVSRAQPSDFAGRQHDVCDVPSSLAGSTGPARAPGAGETFSEPAGTDRRQAAAEPTADVPPSPSSGALEASGRQATAGGGSPPSLATSMPPTIPPPPPPPPSSESLRQGGHHVLAGPAAATPPSYDSFQHAPRGDMSPRTAAAAVAPPSHVTLQPDPPPYTAPAPSYASLQSDPVPPPSYASLHSDPQVRLVRPPSYASLQPDPQPNDVPPPSYESLEYARYAVNDGGRSAWFSPLTAHASSLRTPSSTAAATAGMMMTATPPPNRHSSPGWHTPPSRFNASDVAQTPEGGNANRALQRDAQRSPSSPSPDPARLSEGGFRASAPPGRVSWHPQTSSPGSGAQSEGGSPAPAAVAADKFGRALSPVHGANKEADVGYRLPAEAGSSGGDGGLLRTPARDYSGGGNSSGGSGGGLGSPRRLWIPAGTILSGPLMSPVPPAGGGHGSFDDASTARSEGSWHTLSLTSNDVPPVAAFGRQDDSSFQDVDLGGGGDEASVRVSGLQPQQQQQRRSVGGVPAQLVEAGPDFPAMPDEDGAWSADV